MPESRFAFVFDPVGGLADALRSSGVFTAVFEISEHEAADLCSYLAPSHVSKEVCLSTPWVLVTKRTVGVALFLINGGNGVTSELIKLIQRQDFSNGFIALYNGTKSIDYIQGYGLTRYLLIFMVWSPIGVGTAVKNIVDSRIPDMYEASGVPYRSIMNNFNIIMNIFNTFKTASLYTAIITSSLMLGELLLALSLKLYIAMKDNMIKLRKHQYQ